MKNTNQAETQRPLPDAVCIGASKCGTTSLHYYLHSHPEVGVPRSKEVHFFLDPGNWSKGEDWYRDQFPKQRVLVEGFGGGYSHYPIQQGVAGRMHQVLPRGKLIYMVRDPVDRMISRYMHNVSECREQNEPEVAFSGDPMSNWYISESMYYTQLKQFRHYFDDHQIMIVDNYSFKNDRRKTLQSIFRFLGVDDSVDNAAFDVIRHPSSGKRRKNKFGVALHKYFGQYVLGGLQQLPLPMPLQRAISHRSDQALYWLFSTPIQRPVLDPDFRHSLNELFKPEVEKLQQFAGRKFKGWLRES